MKNLSKKLLEVQKELGAVKKDKENPFFKSKYADINAYIDVIKPVLNKHGLVLLQPLNYVGDSVPRLGVTTMLIDPESGEKIEMYAPLPENPDPQKMGSAITYFRRYALQSLFVMQSDDDDANSASEDVDF